MALPKVSRRVCRCLDLQPAVIENEIEVRFMPAQLPSPKQLYLIGSRAKGTCHSDSDVDVLALLPKGSWTDAQQDQLDQVTEEEIQYGEISEGPQELDIHLASGRPYKPFFSFPELRRQIRVCRKAGFLK